MPAKEAKFVFNVLKKRLQDQVVKKLNSRPRKTLGFATPEEIFYARSDWNVM